MLASPHNCPTRTSLEGLAQGQLPPAETAALAAHVEQCESCSDVLAGIAADIAGGVRSPRDRARQGPARRPWPILVIAAAGAVLLGFLLAREGREPTVLTSTTPAAPWFSVRAFARVSEEIQELGGRAVLHPGDRVRLAVDAARDGFLLVVSIDAQGNARALFPTHGGGSGAFRARDRGFLPEVLPIHATPGRERWFALYTASPMGRDEVSAAARRALAGTPDLAAMVRLPLEKAEQWTLLVEKRPR
jgi:hypothetical protein